MSSKKVFFIKKPLTKTKLCGTIVSQLNMPLKTNEAEIKIFVHSQRADGAENAAERRVSNGLPRVRSKEFLRMVCGLTDSQIYRGFRVFRNVCER